MKIHKEIEQGTDEWLELRRGRITASEVGAFAIAEKSLSLTIPEIKEQLDVLGIEFKKSAKKPDLEALLPNKERYMCHTKSTIDARSTLYAKKIAERSGADMLEQYATKAMQRGNELEPEARNVYEFISGFEVEQVAFVEHDNGLCGASPDGIIGLSLDEEENKHITAGLEIKCHLPEKHALFLLNPDSFEDEHKHQLHWQMAVMGVTWIDLFGYCPKMPYIKRRVYRSEYTERFVKAIDELSEEYKAAIAQYNEIFRTQKMSLQAIKASNK